MFKRVIKTKISHDYFSHNVGMHGTRARALFSTSAAVATAAAAVYRCLDLLKDLLHLSNRLPAYSSPPFHKFIIIIYTTISFRTLFSHQFFHYLLLLFVCKRLQSSAQSCCIANSFMFRYLYDCVCAKLNVKINKCWRKKTFTHENR